MSERALLPGEKEAWERACREDRWRLRPSTSNFLTSWHCANALSNPGDTIAYRARSVRADGTPVVP